VSRKLLEHLGIKKQLVSYYEHNRRESGEKILSRILSGENCALVTDAGTPGISDPGEDLTRMCIEAGAPVLAIPGPCAAVAALCVSGFNAGRFTFEGFLSTSRKSRFEHLSQLEDEKRTMVFYEAPHKLLRTLRDMLDSFGDRRVSITREMTKVFEETIRCTLTGAILHFEETPPRGEFVLIVEGAQDTEARELPLDDAVETVRSHVSGGLTVKDAIKKTALESGVPKNALYNAVIKKD